MEVNKEHLDSSIAFVTAYRNLISLMKAMPEEMIASIHLEKTEEDIRVVEFSCMVVEQMFFYQPPRHDRVIHLQSEVE